jgi:hypothetical protein
VRALFVILMALAACDETGVLQVVGGSDPTTDDTDDTPDSDAPGDSAPDTDTTPADTDPADPNDPPPTPTATCRPAPALSPGASRTTLAGDAALRRDNGFSFDWNWEGCEVERRYDAAGTFLCEVVFEAEGELTDTSNNRFTYELTLTPQPAVQGQTLCTGGGAGAVSRWTYRFSADLGRSTLSLERRRRGATDWTPLGTFPYASNRLFTELTFTWKAAP